MRIVVIRHVEVDFCWSKKCSSGRFDSECSEYDKGSGLIIIRLNIRMGKLL